MVVTTMPAATAPGSPTSHELTDRPGLISGHRASPHNGRSTGSQSIRRSSCGAAHRVSDAAHDSYRMQSIGAAYEDEQTGTDRRQPYVDEKGLDVERIALRQALTHQPDEEQRLVYLRFYEGLTQVEIRERIGRARSTSRVASAAFSEVWRRISSTWSADPSRPRPPLVTFVGSTLAW
jgi:hypothetical protein